MLCGMSHSSDGMLRNQAPSGLPLTHSTLAAGGVLGLDDTLPGMGPIQDMVFYGGHARYPNCTIHTLRVLNLRGHPASLRMDWDTFKTVVERVQSKQLLEVEASRVVCGWSVCCTARVFLRTQSTDLDVFDQIYRQHHLKDVALAAPRSSRYLVDAGANVGFSTMLLASLWPDATVVALEPDEGNLEVLVRNIEHRPFADNVVPLRGGLWGWDASLTIEPTAVHGDWGYVTAAAAPWQEDGTFPGYSVSSVMLQQHMPHIDVLKVDIEGAEAVMFNTSGGAQLETWVNAVNLLALEAHPWFAKEYFGELDVVGRVVGGIGNATRNHVPFALAVEGDSHFFKRVQALGTPCAHLPNRRSMQQHCGR